MLTLNESKMKLIPEKAYNKGVRRCLSVFNRTYDPSIDMNAMEDADDEYFNALYFKEITTAPFSCIRRWDVMRYFLSYDEIAYQRQKGPMKLINDVMDYVIGQAPIPQTVVVVLIPTTQSVIAMDDVDDYLRASDADISLVRKFNDYNTKELLTYLPATEDPIVNQRRLLHRMINMGMSREVECEWVPTKFVVITPDLKYLVKRSEMVAGTEAKLLTYLSKGIQIVELNDRPYVSGGRDLVNRRTTNAFLYFPTSDIYLKSSGVEYEDYFIESKYTGPENTFFRSHEDCIVHLVPHEKGIFPCEAARKIITVLVENIRYDEKYDRYNDFEFLVYSTDNNLSAVQKEIRQIDVSTVILDTLEDTRRVDPDFSGTYFENMFEQKVRQNNYTFLLYHVQNWKTVSNETRTQITHIASRYNVQVIFLQEDPRETNIYEESHKVER